MMKDRPFLVSVISVIAILIGLLILMPMVTIVQVVLSAPQSDWGKIPDRVWTSTAWSFLITIPHFIFLVLGGIGLFFGRPTGWIVLLGGGILFTLPTSLLIMPYSELGSYISPESIGAIVLFFLVVGAFFSPKVIDYCRVKELGMGRSVRYVTIIALLMTAIQVFSFKQLMGNVAISNLAEQSTEVESSQ